jgi:hypothetical protein
MSNKKEPIIVFGIGGYSIKDGKYVTHNVTSVKIDVVHNSQFVTVVIESGIEVNEVSLTMESAQEIGFINVNALKRFCK